MTATVQGDSSAAPQATYDSEVRIVLRTAAHAAASAKRPVTPDNLRAALLAPGSDLPQVQLHKTRATQAVLDRARELASNRAAVYMERTDLAEALAEASAAAAGLDLCRLQFARFALARARQEVVATLAVRSYSAETDSDLLAAMRCATQ